MQAVVVEEIGNVTSYAQRRYYVFTWSVSSSSVLWQRRRHHTTARGQSRFCTVTDFGYKMFVILFRKINHVISSLVINVIIIVIILSFTLMEEYEVCCLSICLSVCVSVCSIPISYESAERIRLKLCTGMEVCSGYCVSHFGGEHPKYPATRSPGEPKMNHEINIVSVLH